MVRANIVLMLLDGHSGAQVARRVGVSERTVNEWKRRFKQHPKCSSLRDLPRSGRPPTIPVEARCQVLTLACQRPDCEGAHKLRFRDIWTYESLRQAASEVGASMSRSEIWRTLHARSLRPHRVDMWLHSQDPDFKAKARVVCDLYRKPPSNAALVCVDEKTGMQALERRYPDRLPMPGQALRREYEYRRHGTRTLIAGFDVRTGEVTARCGPHRKKRDLLAFMRQLAERYPKGDVYVIWDNLNTHRCQELLDFNAMQDYRFHFVYTPKHASWLNQVEIWFGIVHKRVLKHGSFQSAEQLTARVMGFIDHWNRHELHPFRWTFRGFRTTSQLRRSA